MSSPALLVEHRDVLHATVNRSFLLAKKAESLGAVETSIAHLSASSGARKFPNSWLLTYSKLLIA